MPRSHRLLALLLAALLLLATASTRVAAEAVRVDRRISYEGRLSSASGPVTIAFRIVDEAGVPLWGPEPHIVTPDAEGRFFTVVGMTELDADADGVPDLDVLDPAGLQLELSVDDGTGRLLTMTPRQPLVAALHATSADGVRDDAITSDKLRGGAVTGDEILDGAITGAKVAAGTLTGAQLADAGVTNSSIANGSLIGADIAPASIGTSQLASNVVRENHIAPGAVGSSEIVDGSIDYPDLTSIAFEPKFYRGTSWGNDWDQTSSLFQCNSIEVMCGFHSEYSATYHDRRYQLQCCSAYRLEDY